MKVVYLHSSPCGPFYIGSGSLVRAGNVTRPRSPHHLAVVMAHGAASIAVDVLYVGDDAEAFEREVIEHARELGYALVNRTVGRGGRDPGYKHSAETRARIRASNISAAPSATHKTGSRWINNGVIRRKLKRGERMTVGWRFGR